MSALNKIPGSSTPAQRKVLVIEAKRRGIDLDELRSMVGGSVSRLSAEAASNWIRNISGRPLPNAPGRGPRAYARKRTSDNAVRMIAAAHIEQIERLGVSYFDGDSEKFHAWLRKFHHVEDPRLLLTAEAATKVIGVLKGMHTRKEALV